MSSEVAETGKNKKRKREDLDTDETQEVEPELKKQALLISDDDDDDEIELNTEIPIPQNNNNPEQKKRKYLHKFKVEENPNKSIHTYYINKGIQRKFSTVCQISSYIKHLPFAHLPNENDRDEFIDKTIDMVKLNIESHLALMRFLASVIYNLKEKTCQTSWINKWYVLDRCNCDNHNEYRKLETMIDLLLCAGFEVRVITYSYHKFKFCFSHRKIIRPDCLSNMVLSFGNMS